MDSGIQVTVDHLVHRFAETFIVESHALGEGAEDFDIRSAFAERLHRLVGDLEVVVAVGGCKIFVFEKRGCGQNDVGVVGSVGEELLVDDGEKVGALQSANDRIMIGANGCRIEL